MAQQEIVLEAKGMVKQFPGVLALDNVDFTLCKGEVHALVGENGAGKSTLMQILNGVYRADAGQILLDGKPVEINNPMDALHNGIGIVFQELSLIQELSVAENIFPNRQTDSRIGWIGRKQLNARAQSVIDVFDEDIDPAMPVKYLTIAKQQMVEIMKALSHNPKVLIFDEPTSSLTQVETQKLFENIRVMKERGLSIIYISHHLSELYEIADRATVLRDGKVVKTLPIAEADEDKLISLMVGREVKHSRMDRAAAIHYDQVVMEVSSLSHMYYFKDISFKVHAGEILGIYGLVGAGRSEVCKSIFGLEKLTGGEIVYLGEKVKIKNPTQAMRMGIAYTSENRKQDGLFLEKSLQDNCASTQLGQFANAIGYLSDKGIAEFARMSIEKFNIATPSEKQILKNLSGGNQQKVLLSMWLGIEPKLLFVDEPTKGVDVGAKAEIYEILRALADSGVAIVMVSSDLLEVLAVSDNVLILKDGRVAGQLRGEEASEMSVVSYATTGALVGANGH